MIAPRTVQANAASIAAAAACLQRGELVAFPTETVYGLGADATNDRAVAAIYAAKGRPSFNPLIVHVANPEQAAVYAAIDSRAADLAAAFWPGPLTLVLPRVAGCALSPLVSAGLPTVAIRIPAHETALALIQAAGLPIAAPSANRSGRLSPTNPMHVAAEFGSEVAMILAAGRSDVGVESTVVDMTGDIPTILRHGGLDKAALQAVLGDVSEATGHDGTPKSPGMLEKHYAPTTPLRMNAVATVPGEAFLGFGPDMGLALEAVARLNLSPEGDLTVAAANLFAMLHDLDTGGYTGIAVAAIPETGLGQAINDRLRRAAIG
jgi:L-threonylcarbamoyladenylate synthase